ncbi:MAG TPA: SUKH-3 domain-containing protein, partial [Pilimelia sp.]|nr:SUKH-3 domain-containing protein [Pilimelia sp.]
RFPPEVAAVLAAGGWRVSEVDHMLAEAWTGEVLAVPGAEHRHVDLPAARQAMTGLVGAVAGRRGPGLAHWIRVFEINPVAAAHSADILADFGTLIGARLFPLGTEGDNDSILAIDEHGRVFALDQAGEWFLGATADAAVVALVTGQRAARVRDDGTW